MAAKYLPVKNDNEEVFDIIDVDSVVVIQNHKDGCMVVTLDAIDGYNTYELKLSYKEIKRIFTEENVEFYESNDLLFLVRKTGSELNPSLN